MHIHAVYNELKILLGHVLQGGAISKGCPNNIYLRYHNIRRRVTE